MAHLEVDTPTTPKPTTPKPTTPKAETPKPATRFPSNRVPHDAYQLLDEARPAWSVVHRGNVWRWHSTISFWIASIFIRRVSISFTAAVVPSEATAAYTEAKPPWPSNLPSSRHASPPAWTSPTPLARLSAELILQADLAKSMLVAAPTRCGGLRNLLSGDESMERRTDLPDA